MKRWSWMMIILLVLAFPPPFVYPAENDFEFSVEPIFPQSQIGNEGYYHFQGEPNQTVTLQARVINKSDQQMQVLIRGLNAYSSKQGIIYQEEPASDTTSIIEESYQFKNVITTPSEINLEPLETKIVDFSVKVPNISGTLLGSVEFRVFQGTEELANNEEQSQLLIDQYKAVNYGVQVDIGDYTGTTDISFGTPTYSPEQIAMMIPVENIHPVIVPNITGTYEITKEGDNDFSIKGELPSFKMAPMTTFQYPISWAEGTLEPGTYHVSSTLALNGQTKELEETVPIKNDAIEKTEDFMADRGEIEIKQQSFPWMYVIIGIAIIVVILLIWMLVKRKAKPKSRKERQYPGQFPDENPNK
ncbi:DUF916 domain-containing protein [Bacillaceae bacterium CLA-AA-H227]